MFCANRSPTGAFGHRRIIGRLLLVPHHNPATFRGRPCATVRFARNSRRRLVPVANLFLTRRRLNWQVMGHLRCVTAVLVIECWLVAALKTRQAGVHAGEGT
jgi:hypothetical protein